MRAARQNTYSIEEPAVVLFAEPVPSAGKEEEAQEVVIVPAVDGNDNDNDNDDPSSTKPTTVTAAFSQLLPEITVHPTLISIGKTLIWLLQKEWIQDILSYTCLICAFALVFLDPWAPYGRFSGVALSWIVFILTKLEEDRRRRLKDEKEKAERRERRQKEAEEKQRLEQQHQTSSQHHHRNNKLDRSNSSGRKLGDRSHSGKKLDRSNSSGRRKRR
mmetsp:Transcript_21246/g.31563  ORF Transcript_21246/g.31563 Transcript_21246/m.31563 type:complete len:217 (-) Transcript_21246:294-944(-)|eukprot:CAMPEP_0194047520 /NCGR_PEP_ID=MMETSP0009_2-20130614/25015_1 /TAXON_ID=210454 /ORGANISM="Grammatophora oceanica, Strain CCMP 410" /LENGTH=216 /DNA_ID=CAMNT_0038693173 /DNA_START=47 /DNA_END=697 /DNA_ORIENTATION=-